MCNQAGVRITPPPNPRVPPNKPATNEYIKVSSNYEDVNVFVVSIFI